MFPVLHAAAEFFAGSPFELVEGVFWGRRVRR